MKKKQFGTRDVVETCITLSKKCGTWVSLLKESGKKIRKW